MTDPMLSKYQQNNKIAITSDNNPTMRIIQPPNLNGA